MGAGGGTSRMPGLRGWARGAGRGAAGLGRCLHPLSTWEGAGSWEAGSRAGAPCADLAGEAEKQVVESVWAVFGSGPSGPSLVGQGGGLCCLVTGETRTPRLR